MVENILSVRRNFKRRLFLAWAGLIFFIVYLIAVGAAYVVFHTDFFKVDKFEFSGFQKIDPVFIKHFLILEQIRNSAWRLVPPWRWRFLISDNFLFWLGFKQENINLPANLASLELHPDFSKKKVSIEIKERQPFGVWCHNRKMENGKWKIDIGQCFWFDESGALFTSAPSAEGLLIPLIFDENIRPEKLNREMFSIFTRLYSLKNIKIIKFFIKNENLKELEAEIINGPKLYLSLKGENEDLEAVLNKLSGQVEFKNLQYIDLRVPGRVYYK
ncbi:MAG: hypothetical protein HYW34_03235 [Candidatus Brennerbacteria bacterium]|nr:hypothetical protein [Candidatus Brennerbacteria bacterium]